MPISPDAQHIAAYPYQMQVPTANENVTVMLIIQSDGSAQTADMDVLFMDLMNYLQEWPGRTPGQDVMGNTYDLLLYLAHPDNPDPVPGE